MRFKDYIQIGLATLLAAALIKLFVLDAVIVSSPSMERTLLVGDLLLVNKLVEVPSPGSHSPSGAGFSFPHLSLVGQIERGDVIVFRFPGERDDPRPQGTVEYVKRCIGLPGDTVKIRDGELFINGALAETPVHDVRSSRFPKEYVDERLFPRGVKQNLDFYGPVIVPRAGDVVRLHERTFALYEKLIRNEGHTIEYASDGFRIDGVPATKYTVSQDYLFMMGDNRYESSDSRFWGFLPVRNVIGKAAIIYWSHNIDRQAGDDGGGIWNNLIGSVRWDRIGALVR